MKRYLSLLVLLIFAVLSVQITIVSAKNTSASANSALYPIRVKDKCGYIDSTGKIKITPKYQEAFAFSEGLACIKSNNLFGYINNKGNVVIPIKYFLDTRFSDLTRNFQEGLSAVNPSLDDKMIFVNSKGSTVIKAKLKDYAYGFYGNFSSDLAPIAIDNKDSGDSLLGYINKKGVIVIPPIYLIDSDNFRFYEFSESLARVKTNTGWGFINKSGTLSIPATYEDAKPFSDGLAPVKIKDKWGFINKSNKLIIPAKYTNVRPFSDGLAVIALNNKIGYIDKKGKVVIPPKFIYDQDIFDEESEAINLSSRGYVCKAGICDFSEGLASVNINGMWGYIDKEGRIIIKPAFDCANAFFNGISSVIIDGKLGYINKNGKFIWKPSK